MIKIRIFIQLIILSLFLTGTSILSSNDIIQAMKDELKRSMDKLEINTLKKPYFIEYTLNIKQQHIIKSTLGSITEDQSDKGNSITVGIRVGDYKFDNTNFFDFGLSFFGSGDEEERFKNRSVPLELDYNSIRRELWLATDAAYKQVAEVFTKKESAIKSRVRMDTTHDFIFITPEILFDTVQIPVFDKLYFENLTKKISSVFLNYSQIQVSGVSLEYLPDIIYYINSEGREYIKTDFYTGLEVVASTQAVDGMPLADHYTAYSNDPYKLPDENTIMQNVTEIAENLNKMVNSGYLEESYSGPIIFDSQAACEIFAQVFAPNLISQRDQMTEQGTQGIDRYGAFQNKIGGRVLPEFMSVNDFPDKDIFKNTQLIGNFNIDEDGVKSQNVNLVVDGYLKTLLSSRVPNRRIRATNGHKRGGAPMFSVLELNTKDEFISDADSLKSAMLKLCKDRELPFGILVKKLLNQNILYTSLFRMTSGGYPMPQQQMSIPALEVYKIYPDGREELIRGTEIKGLTAQSFKDIIKAGSEKFVLNLLAPSVVSPYMTGGKQYVGCSVITPALLFEDGELAPVEQDYPKLPVISNPMSLKK